MKPYLLHIAVAVVGILIAGCTTQPQAYHIGVSQCLDDAWRQKMNTEMDLEVLHHPEMSLSRRIAYGNDTLQCAQIDSFISERVDILIVSPNNPDVLRPAISKAYRAGIPVIVADRHVEGDEWTAFIGGDNYQVGLLMADWVLSQAAVGSSLAVLEVLGMPGATPERLRHEGLVDGIGRAPSERTRYLRIDSVDGHIDAYTAVMRYLSENGHVDAIVAQNDMMAIEAAKAVRDAQQTGVRIMGVDGIMVGLQAIVDGEIECTAVYPTRGDLLIHTASLILDGKPYEKETVLETMLIDARAAYPLLRQYEERMHDLRTLQLVRMQNESLWQKVSTDKVALMSVIALLGLLFVLAITSVVWMQHKMQREISKTILPQLEDVQEVIQSNKRGEAFMERVRVIVDEHLTDPDLSVESLSSMLMLSRTQLFRKMKQIAGIAPMDYIRERRLLRADELLKTTDMTIQQIALELCFKKPSYFTQCYKEYFGHLPSER